MFLDRKIFWDTDVKNYLPEELFLMSILMPKDLPRDQKLKVIIL